MKSKRVMTIIMSIISMALFAIDMISNDAVLLGLIGFKTLGIASSILTFIKAIADQFNSMTFEEVAEYVNQEKSNNVLKRNNFETKVDDIKIWFHNK